MKFCSECGHGLTVRVPDGDNRERSICDRCATIHYLNPKIVTGCLPVFEDRVLLCRRAIEPRSGLWTLPAGFMENGESAEEGARRETMEEACAHVEIDNLYTLFSLPHISQVYMFFLARLPEPVFQAGEESLAVELFREDQIPWEQLAFPVVTDTLRHFFNDREREVFPMRSSTIEFGRRLGS
ncbi:MAG: NUDIX hydrolase [Gammaproteobacteria bacterium]|nr:NUDIX hydrolase [Gammaproteobacteria bacterium]|tara:strand:- start:1757 stop:2305 length:549 start_codon:yes stop_codon:yes gene_type:complete